MNRNVFKKIHPIAACMATGFIACFWLSSVISEIFGSHEQVLMVKQSILYAFAIFIPAMMLTGISGMKLAGKSSNPLIIAKRKRMPLIAANGVLILIPCAVFLYLRAKAGQFDAVFYGVQVLELAAGLGNLTLMGLNFRDAKRLFAKKRG